MATAYVTFCAVGAYTTNGITDIVAMPARTETITTSGTSAAGTFTARKGEVALIRSDAAHYAVAATAPTAAAASGVYCPVNETVAIALAKGDKIALITV